MKSKPTQRKELIEKLEEYREIFEMSYNSNQYMILLIQTLKDEEREGDEDQYFIGSVSPPLP